MNRNEIRDNISGILDDFARKYGSNTYLSDIKREEMTRALTDYVVELKISNPVHTAWAAIEDQEVVLTGTSKTDALHKWQDKHGITGKLSGKQHSEGVYSFAAFHDGRPLSVFVIREDKL